MDEKLKLNAIIVEISQLSYSCKQHWVHPDTTDYTCLKLTSRAINAEGTHHTSQAQERGLFFTLHIQMALPAMNAVFTHQLY